MPETRGHNLCHCIAIHGDFSEAFKGSVGDGYGIHREFHRELNDDFHTIV